MKLIFCIISLFWTTSMLAQQAYTLSDCIDYTLKHQASVKVYENNVVIAQKQAMQSVAGYLPQVSGSVTSINNLQLQTTVLPAGIVGPEPFEAQFGTKYNTNAAIDVSQTIFDLSKIAGIKAGKPYQEKSELEQQQNEETLIYNTATSFFQVMIYQEQLSILNTNRHKYEEMLDVLRYQYEKGTVLEKDVDRVQVNLNTVTYQIQDADTKLRLSYNMLKNAMGMPMDDSLQVKGDTDYKSLAGMEQDSVQLESLTAYKLNQNAITLEQINLQSIKAGYYPTLDAVGRFGSQSLNNEFSKAFDSWNDFSYIGLSLKVPIFSGLRKRAAVQEEKLKLENQLTSFSLSKDKLRLDYENAKASVGTAYSSYKSNEDNMALAKKVLDVTDYQYQRGVATLTDYLNDDASYKGAQSNYLSSFYNLLISELNYHKSKGTLKEFIAQIQEY